MAGRLLFFTGLDGSGKTTQAHLYLSEARNPEDGWVYRWVRWEPWLTRPLMSLARRILSRGSGLGSERPADDAGHGRFRDRKQGLFRRRWLRELWTTAVLLEYLPQMAVRLVPSLLRGRTVISDRYLFDVLIDLSMNYGYDFDGFKRLSKHPLVRLFPRPHLTVVFDVDPHVGFDRKRDGTPLGYLEDRAPFYRRLVEVLPTVVIDANESLENVQAQLQAELGSGKQPRGGA